MAKKRETPEIWVQRKAAGLWPEMAMDADAIAQLPYGERLRVTLHTGRVPKRLRFYWSLIKKVVDATGCASSAEALHNVIKLECGYTEPVKVRGLTILVPASISFEAMSEEEFTKFLADALLYVATNFAITPEDVFNNERME
jgi:hypothetical protein